MKIPLAIVEDNQVADLSVALENEGIDAFNTNNNDFQVSVIFTQEQDANLTKDEQYEERKREQQEFQNKIERGELAKMDIRRGTTPTVRMAMGGLTNVRPRYNMGIMGLNR